MLSLPPKHILQILPDVLFPQPGEVGVDIPRRSDVRMPQPLLDVFQLPSVIVENTRRAVTDIVKPHLRQLEEMFSEEDVEIRYTTEGYRIFQKNTSLLLTNHRKYDILTMQ